MNDNINYFFGNKNSFGIEVIELKSNSIAKLAIWLNGSCIKGFKKGALIHGFENLRMFFNNIDQLGDAKLSNFSAEDWRGWIVSDETRTCPVTNKFRKKFIRFFGDQLDNYTIISNVVNNQVEWHVMKNSKDNIVYITDLDYSKIVIREYLNWCELYIENLSK